MDGLHLQLAYQRGALAVLQAGQSLLAHGAVGAVGAMVTPLPRGARAHGIRTGRAGDRQTGVDFGAQAVGAAANGADRSWLRRPSPHRHRSVANPAAQGRSVFGCPADPTGLRSRLRRVLWPLATRLDREKLRPVLIRYFIELPAPNGPLAEALI